MLVLSRKLNETIVIDGDIRVTVVGIHGGRIRLGIQAPSSVGVHREEVLIAREQETSCAPSRPSMGYPTASDYSDREIGARPDTTYLAETRTDQYRAEAPLRKLLHR